MSPFQDLCKTFAAEKVNYTKVIHLIQKGLVKEVRQQPSGDVSRNSLFSTLYTMILVIYISLDSQIQILLNDINNYIAANQYTLCGTWEHKKRHFSLVFFA